MPFTCKYQHETPAGTRQLLADSSDLVLDLSNKTVTFQVKPPLGGNGVPTRFTLVGAVSPYVFKTGDVYGYLIVDVDLAISGRIARAQQDVVSEDDTGTFSATHSQ